MSLSDPSKMKNVNLLGKVKPELLKLRTIYLYNIKNFIVTVYQTVL